jgi:flavin reductase (DIM6/NTAB) family NADH-FMN oxidoreductase RutF
VLADPCCQDIAEMTENEFTPDAQNTRAFRDALGCYGTGVTVVTAICDGRPVGMTANSFASVSLDPPLVLWSPAKASMRHGAFVSADYFAIHVMRDNQLAIAQRFAKSPAPFDDTDWDQGLYGVPYLSGCLARFSCQRFAVYDGGDHSVIMGRVTSVTHNQGKGLMFKRGQFGGFIGL